MQESPPHPQARAAEPPLPDPALREVLESIREPALLYLPGGRIAAVNRAAARLTTDSVVGMTLDELLDRNPARRADGSPILRGDLPYARALRGEIVAQGERIEITLPRRLEVPDPDHLDPDRPRRQGRGRPLGLARLRCVHARLSRRRPSPAGEDPADGT